MGERPNKELRQKGGKSPFYQVDKRRGKANGWPGKNTPRLKHKRGV